MTLSAFSALDRCRRRQGRTADALGYGPARTPFRVAADWPGVRLRSYGDGKARSGPVLVVPAPIKRPYIWDLLPRVSVVRRLVQGGWDVYLLDWTDFEDNLEAFGLQRYADDLIGAAVDEMTARTGIDRPVLIGHSLGGTLAAIFSAAHSQRVNALVLIEAPLAFGKDAGAFAPVVAATPPAGQVIDIHATVPGSLLNVLSALAAPESFQWERWLDWVAMACDYRRREIQMRVERWSLDEFALPGRLFTEVVEWLYREDRFRRGTLRIGGRCVAAADMALPVLAVVNPSSRVVPPKSAVTPLYLAENAERRVLSYAGERGVALQHLGVLVGEAAHRELWPEIEEWLQGHVGAAMH